MNNVVANADFATLAFTSTTLASDAGPLVDAVSVDGAINMSGPGGGGDDPGPGAATPELDSIVLFGLGALGLAGYAWRQRRKPAA